MTKRDIDAFGVILKAKQADASRTLQSREGIMIEKSADELDEIERAVARDVAIQNLERESRLLRDIRSALDRIDAGTFGTCLHCGRYQPETPGGGALGEIVPAMSGSGRPR
jgi:DnaK suppressor protein